MVSIGIELNEQEYKKTSLGVRFLHNTRTLKTNNSIFSTEYNFTKSLIDLKNLDEVNEYFSNEEEELKKFVKEKTKQKSKNKFHIIESIISISDDEEINTLTLEEQKKLLIKKTEDYISHLKNKGITFNFISEHEAIKVLQSNNYLFKLMSYRTNFNKKNGKYENLDFAMLSDLATIDMALRYLILKMSLDYEHAVKVKILDLITLDDSENGYAVVEKFKNESPKSYHIALNYLQKNNYQQVFYRKHNENIAVWSLLEILPFGSLSFFIEFYYKLTNYSQLKYAFHLTKLSKNLRNAFAHNNPLLLNFYSRETRIKPSQTV